MMQTEEQNEISQPTLLQLNEQTQNQLIQLFDENKFEDVMFEGAVKESLNSYFTMKTDTIQSKFLPNNNPSSPIGNNSSSSSFSSATHAAIIYLFLEAAKINCPTLEFFTYLEEVVNHFQTKQNLPLQSEICAKRIQLLSQLYEQNRVLIRRQLSLQTQNFQFVPQLLDVDYRLDYSIKTNQIQRKNEIMYTLRLICSNNNTIQMVSSNEQPNSENAQANDELLLTCNLEQLTDLYTKLRDAATQIQRSLSNTQ